MRQFLLTFAIASLALGTIASACPGAPERRLNVVFIVVDDLNNDLGCYGHGTVKSPHIDRLATRAMRFTRAYCQYALCAPSRCSFLSGLRPETTKVFDLQTVLRTRIPDVVFLPQLFRQNGYFTAGMGKVFHDTKQSDAEQSWDFYQDKMGEDAQEAAAVKKRYGYAQGKRPFEWTRLDSAGDKTRDATTARGIARFIEVKARTGVPFFVAAGFHKPHLPWTAPAPYFDLYPPERVAIAPERALKDIPAIALMTELTGNPAPRSRAEAMAAYYACTSFVDAQVGVLLETLDRLQLWDNTVVVLLSDHGYHLGDHEGLWAKLTAFEQAARVPLLIAAPGHGGQVELSHRGAGGPVPDAGRAMPAETTCPTGRQKPRAAPDARRCAVGRSRLPFSLSRWRARQLGAHRTLALHRVERRQAGDRALRPRPRSPRIHQCRARSNACRCRGGTEATAERAKARAVTARDFRFSDSPHVRRAAGRRSRR
jgi:iduronate 2-sulfatase